MDVMKTIATSIIGLAVLSVLTSAGLQRSTPDRPTIHVSLVGATNTVQATIYSSDNCIPCQRYLKRVRAEMPKDGWTIADSTDATAAAAHIVIEKRSAEITAAAVDAVPTTIIRKNGTEVKRIQGEITPESLANAFNATKTSNKSRFRF